SAAFAPTAPGGARARGPRRQRRHPPHVGLRRPARVRRARGRGPGLEPECPMRQWVKNLFARKPPPARHPRFPPTLEPLGARLAPAAFTVTNLNDSGAGSLRQAVQNANASAGADVITFQDGLSGTITLTSGQLSVTGPVSIRGPGSEVLAVSGNHASRIFKM